MLNYFVVKFGIAYIIDLILGDPRWLYHPVIIIGKLISFLEKILYKAKNKIFSGAILNILTLSTTFIVSLLLARAGYVIEIFFLYTTFATKSLADEGKKVYNILKSGDIEKAKKVNLDKRIVVIHWGIEYQQKQNKKQEEVAQFLFDNGVDIIIGGHPHVLQPMYYYPQTGLHKEQMVVYSLGNFVSNQRKSSTDGGAMVELTLFKDAYGTRILDKGYYLVWVNRTPKTNKKYLFEILPCKEYEEDNFKDLTEEAKDSMNIFINNSRKLFKGNILVEEK